MKVYDDTYVYGPMNYHIFDKKTVRLEGSTIQNLQEIKALCIWPPAINLMKVYNNAESLDDSEYTGA
jgi:hypothetical protein